MRLPYYAILSACVAVAGCGGEVITGTAETRPILATERSALANGPRQVEVLGAPPDAASPGAVAAALRVPGERNERPFSAVPARSGGQRVVIEFGQQAGGQRSCSAPRGSDAGQTLQMAVTYCTGDRALTTVTVRSPTVTGPSHPDFARMMDRVMLSLLQVEQRRRIGD